MRVKVVVSLLALLFAANLWALSPPQYELQRKLAATVGASPFVEVGEVREVGGQLVIDIHTNEANIGRSVAFILEREYAFGGLVVTVRVFDEHGAAVTVDDVVVPGLDAVDTVKYHFGVALVMNPRVVGFGPKPLFAGDFSVEVRPEVVQFWNDNLGDPRGLTTVVAASAFQDVVRKSFIGGTVRMLFSSAPVPTSPGHLDGWVLAAAHAPGRFGSVWTTDLWITSETATAIDLTFLPADRDNTEAVSTGIALPLHNGVLKLTDVVASVFHTSGVGAIRYISDGPVHVVSRTWTPTAGGGTSGETAPGVPASSFTRSSCARPVLVTLVDQHEGFRANLGLLNASHLPARVEVRILTRDGQPAPGSATIPVELPPFGNTQLGDVLDGLYPGGGEALRVEARLVSSGGALMGYLSEVDNTTNDSSYQEAFGCHSE